MANQNLSQFGEKLFVADADHTFIWDSAVSISKRVSRNSWLNSGTLTSDAPVTISQTWNGTGSTVFKALVVNATTPGTTSSSSSLLLDLQVGTVSQFSVSKAGGITASNALFNTTNARSAFLHSIQIGSSSYIGFTANYNPDASPPDTILLRDGDPNTLALRNGAAAQTFNVYGTSSSNNTVYERMFMRYSQSALAFQVGTEQLGATSRPLEFFTNGTRKFAIAASGINTSTFYGHDNTNSSILILRTLSGTAKGQFYVNPSGNCEFGLGFPAAGFPILLSESGNSYFNGGNVGIGTTSPTSKLQVSAGDVEVDTIAKGVILKSPDGTRYRITVPNGGASLTITAV